MILAGLAAAYMCHTLAPSGMKEPLWYGICIPHFWYGTCRWGVGMGFAWRQADLRLHEHTHTTSRFKSYLIYQNRQFLFFSLTPLIFLSFYHFFGLFSSFFTFILYFFLLSRTFFDSSTFPIGHSLVSLSFYQKFYSIYFCMKERIYPFLSVRLLCLLWLFYSSR